MDPCCRICLDSTDEPLISPCAGCRGSSAFVHLSCVVGFYRSRASWLDLACPTCRHVYEGKAAVDLGLLGLAEASKAEGPEHRSVAGVLVNLSNAYGRLGDATQQRDLLERALRIFEREFGPDHRAVASTLVNLGNAYSRLGDAGRQRDLLERALRIKEKEFGPEHREVAITLTNLGNSYGDLGDAARQRDLLHRALDIKEREYGPSHREVAITLTNLGNAYGDLGNAARKRDLLERALAIKEREFGPEHREVAITLTNLGNAFGDLGNSAKQRALLLRALAIEEREFGPEHHELAVTLTSLSVAHAALSEPLLAASASARAHRIAREALPAPNAIFAEMRLFAAVVLRAAADGKEAVAADSWRAAFAELRAAVGEDTASAKLGSFANHASLFWRAAERIDVAEWLEGQADANRTAAPAAA